MHEKWKVKYDKPQSRGGPFHSQDKCGQNAKRHSGHQKYVGLLNICLNDRESFLLKPLIQSGPRLLQLFS